jgi:hypothetical protein
MEAATAVKRKLHIVNCVLGYLPRLQSGLQTQRDLLVPDMKSTMLVPAKAGIK